MTRQTQTFQFGTEVKVDGEELIIMKESDILGIIG